VYLSKAYIPTQKETPSDAEIPSHRLMIRAGLIRILVAGVYSYLPLGWRVIKKVINIIREEMDNIGGQELQLPMLNPIDIWEETGRSIDFGDELFRLKDRKNRSLVLAPTHEEVICDLARKYIKSYKDMPQIWYQIQTKFRDEPRPRSGVIRTRQFLMKDSYTLDVDEENLKTAYQFHAEAYKKIFNRCGILFYIAGASSGLMGGSGSQEFMIESEHGEDTLTLCNQCKYALNLEIAISKPSSVKSEVTTLEKIPTPGQKTIVEVSQFLKKSPNELMKSLIYVSNNKPVMILIRGDHNVNETKLQSYLGSLIRPAHPDEVKSICGAEIGYIGPINLKKPIRIIADSALKDQHSLTTGANESDYHFSGIELDRDVNIKEFTDIRGVSSGEECLNCGGSLEVINAIELGHIFMLGTKYSESMKAFYLNERGKERPIYMGSYGIGVERIIASVIEQNHDENGIVWNTTLAPYQVHIIPLNSEKEEILKTANSIYQALISNKIDSILDDRNISPGNKFKDADLLGMPLQIIIGKKWLNEKIFEIKIRKSGEKTFTTESELISTVNSLLASL